MQRMGRSTHQSPSCAEPRAVRATCTKPALSRDRDADLTCEEAEAQMCHRLCPVSLTERVVRQEAEPKPSWFQCPRPSLWHDTQTREALATMWYGPL